MNTKVKHREVPMSHQSASRLLPEMRKKNKLKNEFNHEMIIKKNVPLMDLREKTNKRGENKEEEKGE